MIQRTHNNSMPVAGPPAQAASAPAAQNAQGAQGSASTASPSGEMFEVGTTHTGAAAAQKDATESSTTPKFGEILKKVQSQYGAKAEKPREAKKVLGKDDFLKIMITQMKFQDPTSPFKPDQMAAQMAQFASVEQLQNVNQSLGKMSQANSPMERLAMTNMIGKTVTVDRERFVHTEGTNDLLSFALPKEAKEATLMVINDHGETVYQKDMGELVKGANEYSWDGLKANSLPAKTGNYMFRVIAKDDAGNAMQTNPQTRAHVVGISFEGSEPLFLVGDAKHQDKIPLKNIVRIETTSSDMPVMQMQQTGQAPAASEETAAEEVTKPKNFIAFQKGQGSSNLDASQASPEIAEALARFNREAAVAQAQPQVQAQPQQPPRAQAALKPEEKGFPNGLSGGFNSTGAGYDSEEAVAINNAKQAYKAQMKGGDSK